MGANTDQIEREIRAERDELGRNLEDLEFKAKELTDWKVHYRNHPGVFLGAAAGIGVLLGAVMAPANGRARAPLGPRLRFQGSPKVAQLVSTWGLVSDALLGLATAKAIDAIAEYLPGFKDEYERQSTRPRRGDPMRSADMT